MWKLRLSCTVELSENPYTSAFVHLKGSQLSHVVSALATVSCSTAERGSTSSLDDDSDEDLVKVYSRDGNQPEAGIGNRYADRREYGGSEQSQVSISLSSAPRLLILCTC